MSSNSNHHYDPFNIIVLSEDCSNNTEDTITLDLGADDSALDLSFSDDNMSGSGWFDHSDYSFTLTDILDQPNDVTIHRGAGKEIKVAETLERIDDKLDAIITRVEMVEQALCDSPEVKHKLESLPSLEDLIEQKHMIDTIKRSGDV